MVNYRCCKIQGGCYFFTVTLHNRKSQILIEHINLLRDAIDRVKKSYPFKMNAYVFLPDHLHMIWTLPVGDNNFSIRWNQIKGLFVRELIKQNIPLKKNHHREYKLWQRRFWEHVIRDEKDLNHHVNYIHYNPVKHRLVKSVKDWPYSSFHEYVKRKIYPVEWGGVNVAGEGDFGE